MSEKLLTPLDIMPPALRHAVTTILTKYQHLDQNPSAANYSSLAKPYEALKSLWAELQWEPYERDLQALEASLKQQQAERPRRVQQSLSELQGSYDRILQQRRRRLQQRKQDFEQKKQELRNSMSATRQQLAEKLQQLSLTSEQLIAQQLLNYESEWTSAERRIEAQKQRLQQAKASFPTDLQQHKSLLRNAFEQLKKSLTDKQQQNSQRRGDLPALAATWKTAASARETRLREELESWKAKHPTSADEVPSWPELHESTRQLTERRQSLTARSLNLHQRKYDLANAEQNMQTEWQRASAKPHFSAPPSSEQRTDWLRKSRPLREALSELRQLTTRCALLKAELLSGGFLGPDEFSEIDVAWAEAG